MNFKLRCSIARHLPQSRCFGVDRAQMNRAVFAALKP